MWWRHLRAVSFAPLIVVAGVPLLIWLLVDTFAVSGLPVAVVVVLTVLGVAAVAAGVALVVWTNVLFHRVGKGTLAPWDSPTKLVVRGPYRYVRNPMISGVLAILLGEALALRSVWLLGWFAAFWLVCMVSFLVWEEPDLARRFGEEYETYRRNVPRWIPRRRPWDPR